MVLKGAPRLPTSEQQLQSCIESIRSEIETIHSSKAFWNDALNLGRRALSRQSGVRRSHMSHRDRKQTDRADVVNTQGKPIISSTSFSRSETLRRWADDAGF